MMKRATDASFPLSATLGPGLPLSPSVRDFFEPRLGVGLDGVRVHVDSAAARAAFAVQAQAFTLGDHIVFSSGHRQFERPDTQRILAHELVHIAQNRSPQGTLAAREIRRVPAVSNCDRKERSNILAAHATAMRWLRLALSRLSNPNAAAAELSFHFRIAPSDRGAVASIRGELSQALAELGAESISYNCAVATDPACVNPDLGEIAGFATLGGHDASFCGEHAEQGGEALADTLLHEVMHAKAPGIPDGPYRHWAAYPGSDPMNNADAYTSFVTTIARGIHGEARAPLKAESGLVVVFGQARILGVAEETVEETVDGFVQNEFAIPPENVVQLDALLDRWQREFANVPVTLRTAGHTDGSTSSEQTAALSERRARAVTDYLLDQMAARMIPFPVHVDVRGFGSARPFIEPGRDRSGRLLSESLNRRVEIEIRPHRQ